MNTISETPENMITTTISTTKGGTVMQILKGRVTGKHLLSLGYIQAAWFKRAIKELNDNPEYWDSDDTVEDLISVDTVTRICDIIKSEWEFENTLTLKRSPTIPELEFSIDNLSKLEEDNFTECVSHMLEIGRLPNIMATMLMPDACPVSGVLGTIPVGGVAVAKNAIFPTMHSADVCCSLAMTRFYRATDELTVKEIMDTAQITTHFGHEQRETTANEFFGMKMSDELIRAIENNSLLSPLMGKAVAHFGTQGDGNHFLFLGKDRADEWCLVTHHGSRGFGAALYKKSVELAKRNCAKWIGKVPGNNYWIDANSNDGKMYWEALQVIRLWTKENHFAIHNAIIRQLKAKKLTSIWNEHNFVFQRKEGFFTHAKGATPVYVDGANDDYSGLSLIPLNMSEPILVVRNTQIEHALGFAPHGAGRNMSRTKLANTVEDKEAVIEEAHSKIDLRWYGGKADISELPLAYKDPQFIRTQMREKSLAIVVDEIRPLGCIMMGQQQNV
jgi:tRNA-splicing ligase RtcB (3'-phosphate/5'-hydroxy nucleic acid ligase)